MPLTSHRNFFTGVPFSAGGWEPKLGAYPWAPLAKSIPGQARSDELMRMAYAHRFCFLCRAPVVSSPDYETHLCRSVGHITEAHLVALYDSAAGDHVADP